jgi:hypothetical protein
MPPSFLELMWYYVTGNLQEVRLKPGDRLESDDSRVLIVTRGTGQVVRDGPGGHDILLRVVRQGAVVADGNTLMAETPLDVVALPRKELDFSKRGRAGE